MLLIAFLAFAVFFLAFSNGANDNFKGVATVYGSGALSYRQALALATVAQVLGSLTSLYFATALVKAFSGSGLIDPAVAASVGFLLPVALAAGATVILATRFGLPISTTHALIGALVGTGLVLAHASLQWQVLTEKFVAPLLLSPVAGIVLTMILYRIVKAFSVPENGAKPAQAELGNVAMTDMAGLRLSGANAQMPWVNAGHFASAFSLCFARALNDTPKLMGLLVVWKALDVHFGMLAIAIAMAIGGIVAARKVAAVMSQKISAMDSVQALTANFVAAALVIAASRFGLPVSTTHVTVAAITGIGLSNGSADMSAIKKIFASWLLTLPIAALLAATLAYVVRAL